MPEINCEEKCIYCNQSVITGQKSITEDDVIDRLRDFLNSVEEPKREFEFSFFGGTFTALSNYTIKEALDLVEKRFMGPDFLGIRFSTHPAYIDENIINLLKDYKIATIELGIQSFDETVLKVLGRTYGLDVIYRAVDLIKKNGYCLGLQLMISTPKESISTHLKNLKNLRIIKPDYLRIYPLIIIKDTPLHSMYIKGSFTPPDIEDTVKSTYLYLKYSRLWNIKIIRMGLKNEPSLMKMIIAGPFHESFGELCWSYYFYRHIIKYIKHKTIGTFIINPADISKFLGYKRKNIKKISNLYDFELKYKLDKNIPSGEIHFLTDINSGKDGNSNGNS